jgi:hypothetical protein
MSVKFSDFKPIETALSLKLRDVTKKKIKFKFIETQQNPLYDRIISTNINKKQLSICVLVKTEDGKIYSGKRQFSTSKSDLDSFAAIAASIKPDQVTIKSTSTHYERLYRALERQNVNAKLLSFSLH